MTTAERTVLSDIVQIIQTLTNKVDALEGALVHKGVLRASDRPAREAEYLQAALSDLAAVRTSIAFLPVIGSVKG